MAFLKHLLRTAMRAKLAACCLLGLLGLLGLPSHAEDLVFSNERELKVAFLYNFTLFTAWPPDVGPTLNMCILGMELLGKEVNALQTRTVGSRAIVVQRKGDGDSLKGCQVVFIAASTRATGPHLLDELRGQVALIVSESVDIRYQGAALNMAVNQNKITFSANLQAARANRISLSSKLLRLATEVIQ